jgi:predicted O-methyltransferase YrrM
MTKVKESLSLNTPWAIGENKYDRILQVLSGRRVEQIVEFGSGVSTVRLGQDFPKAHIVSIEQHDRFCRKTVELLQQYQVENVKVLHCPVRLVRIGLRWYLTYDLSIDRLEWGVDFMLIDGPVESQTLRGREAPLYVVFPLLRSGSLIALDDYHRDSAKAVVRNWLSFYPDSLKMYEEVDDLVLLQKCGEQSQPSYPGFRSLADNMLSNLALLRRTLLCRFRQAISRAEKRWID